MWTLFCTPHYSSSSPLPAPPRHATPSSRYPYHSLHSPFRFPLFLPPPLLPELYLSLSISFYVVRYGREAKIFISLPFPQCPQSLLLHSPLPLPPRSVPMSPMDDDGCQASAIRCYYVYSMHTERVVSVTIAHSDCNCNCGLHWRFLASVELISICRVASLFIILAQLL